MRLYPLLYISMLLCYSVYIYCLTNRKVPGRTAHGNFKFSRIKYPIPDRCIVITKCRFIQKHFYRLRFTRGKSHFCKPFQLFHGAINFGIKGAYIYLCDFGTIPFPAVGYVKPYRYSLIIKLPDGYIRKIKCRVRETMTKGKQRR